MSPRERKPPVKPEKRQEWLERYESGQSPPKIAAADKYDARTVRKHIELAKQEKETKDARASVLRSALERHYADLCRYAERLAGQSSDGYISEFGAALGMRYEEQLGIALRQHLPRSPIWSLLSQEARLHASKAELIIELGRKIESGVASESRFPANLTDEENGVVPGLIDALKAQAERWADGQNGLNVKDNLISEPAEDGFVSLRYGAYNVGKVRKEHVELVRGAIIDWTALVKDWEEYRRFEKTLRDIKRVKKELGDEIAVIALRRVVPGRCRYCPL